MILSSKAGPQRAPDAKGVRGMAENKKIQPKDPEVVEPAAGARKTVERKSARPAKKARPSYKARPSHAH